MQLKSYIVIPASGILTCEVYDERILKCDTIGFEILLITFFGMFSRVQ